MVEENGAAQNATEEMNGKREAKRRGDGKSHERSDEGGGLLQSPRSKEGRAATRTIRQQSSSEGAEKPSDNPRTATANGSYESPEIQSPRGGRRRGGGKKNNTANPLQSPRDGDIDHAPPAASVTTTSSSAARSDQSLIQSPRGGRRRGGGQSKGNANKGSNTSSELQSPRSGAQKGVSASGSGKQQPQTTSSPRPSIVPALNFGKLGLDAPSSTSTSTLSSTPLLPTTASSHTASPPVPRLNMGPLAVTPSNTQPQPTSEGTPSNTEDDDQPFFSPRWHVGKKGDCLLMKRPMEDGARRVVTWVSSETACSECTGVKHPEMLASALMEDAKVIRLRCVEDLTAEEAAAAPVSRNETPRGLTPRGPTVTPPRSGGGGRGGDGDVSRLQAKIEQLTKSLKAQQAESQKHETVAAELRNLLQSSRHDLDDSHFKSVSNATASFVQELAGLRSQLTLANQSVTQSSEENKRLSEAFSEQQRKHQLEVEALQSKLDQKENDLRMSLQGLSQMQSWQTERYQEVIAERDTALSEVTRLKCELATVAANNDRPNEASLAQLADSQAAVQSLTADRDRLALDLRASTHTTQQLSTELLAVREKLTALEICIQGKEKEHALALEAAHGEGERNSCTNASLREEILLLSAQLATAVANERDAKLQEEVAKAELYAKQTQFEAARRALHNEIMDLRGNVRVIVRVRPFLDFEERHTEVLSIGGDLDCANSVTLGTNTFTFNRVLDGDASQVDMFNEVSNLVQSALDGYKVVLLAYGQTGSGKTHTMSGTDTDPGIISRSMEQIVASVASQEELGWDYCMSATYTEVYNEQLRDLLVGYDSKNKTNLQIHHDTFGNTAVLGALSEPVVTVEDAQALLARGQKNRSTAATAMNEFSSRSHSIFTLSITGTDKDGTHLEGTLHFVDLAGSERVSKSQATGDRLKEAASINKSLSSLGDVFTAVNRKQAHVPFRNSKLTYYLQGSLSGQGKAMMIINLSPLLSSSEETLCSLRFGALVSNCELGSARRNINNSTSGDNDSVPQSPQRSITPSLSCESLTLGKSAKPISHQSSSESLGKPATGANRKKPPTTPTTPGTTSPGSTIAGLSKRSLVFK